MAVWPRVAAHLIAVLPGLPGWAGVIVFDGPPVSGDDPSEYMVVGWSASNASAGTYSQVRNNDGHAVDEAGVVSADLTVQNGDGDMAAARSRAFDLADSLDAHLRADQTLAGVLGTCGVCVLSVDVLPVQASTGVAQSLALSVSYEASTYTP